MKTLVLLSGGVDSTVCLHLALRRSTVAGLFVDYGQRHIVERRAARAVAKAAGVTLYEQRVTLPRNNWPLADQVAFGEKVTSGNAVIPGRNTLFLALAGIHAAALGADRLVIGVTSEDYADFPDCRDRFISAMQRALILGTNENMRIEAPLVHKTKAEAIELAKEIGCLEALSLTWSCYEGVEDQCGRCPACLKTEAAFLRAGIGAP